jgi:Fe-Mn family superoxide dismutase
MRYHARQFDLSGLKGISDATLEQHFKLYEGYVAQTNGLITKLTELNKNGGGVDEKRMPEYSELKRRLGFEYNGMVLHELYFGNLRKHGDRAPARGSPFREAVEASWHSYQDGKPTSSASGRCAAWDGPCATRTRRPAP